MEDDLQIPAVASQHACRAGCKNWSTWHRLAWKLWVGPSFSASWSCASVPIGCRWIRQVFFGDFPSRYMAYCGILWPFGVKGFTLSFGMMCKSPLLGNYCFLDFAATLIRFEFKRFSPQQIQAGWTALTTAVFSSYLYQPRASAQPTSTEDYLGDVDGRICPPVAQTPQFVAFVQ